MQTTKFTNTWTKRSKVGAVATKNLLNTQMLISLLAQKRFAEEHRVRADYSPIDLSNKKHVADEGSIRRRYVQLH